MKSLIITLCTIFLISSSSLAQASGQQKGWSITPVKVILATLSFCVTAPILYAQLPQTPCLPCIISSPHAPAFSSTYVAQPIPNPCLACTQQTNPEPTFLQYIQQNPYPGTHTSQSKNAIKKRP